MAKPTSVADVTPGQVIMSACAVAVHTADDATDKATNKYGLAPGDQYLQVHVPGMRAFTCKAPSQAMTTAELKRWAVEKAIAEGKADES